MIAIWKKLELKEQKKQLNNVIIIWNKLKKKLELKEQKKQLNNMIIIWNKANVGTEVLNNIEMNGMPEH